MAGTHHANPHHARLGIAHKATCRAATHAKQGFVTHTEASVTVSVTATPVRAAGARAKDAIRLTHKSKRLMTFT